MSRVSERVLQVLRERGWTQKTLIRGRQVCVRGAVVVAQSEETGDTGWIAAFDPPPPLNDEYQAFWSRLVEIVCDEYGEDASPMAVNDDPNTELLEIIDLVERAGESG